MYINCKTNFSLLYGTLTVDELVAGARENGTTCIALTNINSTCDTWDFVYACKNHGIKPIAGVEVRNGDELLYILLAVNNQGFSWINQFLSAQLQNNLLFPLQIQADSSFTGSENILVIYPLGKKLLPELLCNEFIGIAPWEVNKLFGINLKEYQSKFVVRHPVTFKNNQATQYNIHKLLRAIDKNTLLSKLSPADLASPNEYFTAPSKILEAFQQYPCIVSNTHRLIESCEISMEPGIQKNKKVFSGSTREDANLLKELAHQGCKNRYGENKLARQRVDHELKIIDKLDLNAYFLITWDIIRFAQSKVFFYVGRGSGANSVVAYCLQLTNVDPIELDLNFECFLNVHRTSSPDFDIDFSWLDRDEVIDYIFKRYGTNHVAMLGSYATFQYNATVRELGKVFGLPKHEIEEFGSKGRYYGPSRVQNVIGYDKQDNYHRLIEKYGGLISGFPHHHSVHAGGILITDEPIYNYTATLLPSKNFLTTQLDMYAADTIGLHKLDILSQRGLGHIKETIRLVKENKNQTIDIGEIEKFKVDPLVKEQLKNGNTTGCFYVESPGMRQLLRKLKCNDYLTLVAASSITRPGVASSGMMKEYVSRFHDPKKMSELNPVMGELLRDTFGVMIYQEDVVKVAHEFGGLDLAEADTLKRALNEKNKNHERVETLRNKFFNNSISRGHTYKLVYEVWRQIESFAGYAFSKAHAASYAVESFQDLYLKANYPMEFMVAVINNFGGFYPTSVYFYQLIKIGARLQLPCVNRSDYLTRIEGRNVYTGLVHIQALEKNLGQNIIKERERNGAYMHLQDFIERTAMTVEQLNALISIDAFRFTGKNKKELLWEANIFQKKAKQHVPARNSLFPDKPKNFSLPELSNDPVQDLYDEMEILGFPLRNPFELADADVSKYQSASALSGSPGKSVTLLGYFITDKIVPTKNRQAMSFGTFIDQHMEWVDTVHFPDSLQRYPLQGKGFYQLTGKVIEEFGCYSLEVHLMKKIGYKERKYAML